MNPRFFRVQKDLREIADTLERHTKFQLVTTEEVATALVVLARALVETREELMSKTDPRNFGP